jgi:hypothetical protein
VKELHTLYRKVPFLYDGGVGRDTVIRTQGRRPQTIRITAVQWRKLLEHFQEQEVKIGRSKSSPPAGSLGEWLNQALRKPGAASYVAPILVSEGYATEISEEDNSRLKFGDARL